MVQYIHSALILLYWQCYCSTQLQGNIRLIYITLFNLSFRLNYLFTISCLPISYWADLLLEEWYFVTKIVLTYCEKKMFQWSRIILKFKTEGREFANFLRSLEQLIQTKWRIRSILGNRMFFKLKQSLLLKLLGICHVFVCVSLLKIQIR